MAWFDALGLPPSRGLVRRKNLRAKKDFERAAFCLKVNSLRNQSNLTIPQIASRLKCTIYKVGQALAGKRDNLAIKRGHREQRKGSKPLHQRAKTLIQSYILNARFPVQAPSIQAYLKSERGCNFSLFQIRKYIKEELGLTYKRVTLVNPLQNSIDCLLQRQYAAGMYIDALSQGKRIINIDESIIRMTDQRKYGWSACRSASQPAFNQRLNSVNIIAGICSNGSFFFSVNKGKTNSVTFLHFLIGLVCQLQILDASWRSNTVFMLDNASYHRSSKVAEAIKRLDLDCLFLGPYHYKMAPVERLFAIIKNRDLNRMLTRIHSKKSEQEYLKELAVTISKVDASWIQKSFVTHLEAALQSLSLYPN